MNIRRLIMWTLVPNVMAVGIYVAMLIIASGPPIIWRVLAVANVLVATLALTLACMNAADKK